MPTVLSARRATLLIALVLFGPTVVGALGAQEMRAARPMRQVEFWGGLAHHSPRWGVLGDTPDMSLAIFAIRIERPLRGPTVVGSTQRTMIHMDFIPLALMSPAYESLGQLGGSGCEIEDLCVGRPDGSGLFSSGAAAAVGLNPLGITTHFRQRSYFSPSIGVTGGVLLFDRATPTTASSHFNFTAAVEVGLRIGPPERAGIVLAYRLHHISNAGLAHENPAVASHLLTIGLRAPPRILSER